MRFLALIALLTALNGEWIVVDTHTIKAGIEFPASSYDTGVTSTYVITVLEDQITNPLKQIAAFKVVLMLETGYTITRVLKEWEQTEVESASGEAKMKAIVLKVALKDWEHWDLEIFKSEVSYKLKSEKNTSEL